MSNQNVGAVYQHIMQDVIDSSRVDIEEAGVDESILEELKLLWQRKLTALSVASFPWDPKPEAAPVPAAPTPVIANLAPPTASPYTQSQLSPPPNVQPLAQPVAPPSRVGLSTHGPEVKSEPSQAKAEPSIKQEAGAQNGAMPPPHSGLPQAMQRAAQNLQSQYGQRAAASINAMQAQAHPQQPQQPAAGQSQMTEQYRRQISASQAQQRANIPNGVGTSQVDGVADGFEGVLARRNSAGNLTELGTIELDAMLHEQLLAKAQRMEGGGLMLPLKEATKHAGKAVVKMRGGAAGQLDGLDDDVKDDPDLDDDAINSDLDDPDDDRDDSDEDDEIGGHIMLCMYDKVQRVKNKWKCTLKDGVLTVNGREYVFHKATGEYEW